MLLTERRLQTLRSFPSGRLTLQISLDSPAPERHDLHRGKGTWMRAWNGVMRARAEGLRVRLAATVASDGEADEFRQFLDAHRIPEENRVIRRIALRGFATEGIALARADLVPEITITAQRVFWHPVGADDADLLVTTDIFPLAKSFTAVRRAFERESEHRRRLASIFNCV
jgi:sulfatase maturation enzyme AslB (radical SAM superfamily)